MPENTIPAMFKAIDLGVTTLEMDAVITRDKQVILSHEPFFNHIITTKPNGDSVQEKEAHNLNIYHMTYAETRGYDVGKRPHPGFPQQQRMAATKPLLEEVIDSVEAYTKSRNIAPVFYNIETKCQPATDTIYHPVPEAFTTLLLEVIYRKKIEDRVIIQSFDFRTLQLLNQKYPAIKTAALVEGSDGRTFNQHIKTLGFTPTIYSPFWKMVTPELIEQCHQKQIKIIPWTVNDKENIDRLKAMGVDGIISDYPNLFNE